MSKSLRGVGEPATLGDHEKRIRSLEFAKPTFDGPAYAYGIYVYLEPDVVTVAGDGTNSFIPFNTLLVLEGVASYVSGGDPTGFHIPTGLWHLSAQVHWGSADPGYEKAALLGGLVFSYVAGSIDMDMESSDIIPDNSNAYVNKISTIFRQQEPNPAFAPILQLGVNQLSGVNKTLQSAVLAAVKLRDL